MVSDLRAGVSPVVHRVLDRAAALQDSMARFDADAVVAELNIELRSLATSLDAGVLTASKGTERAAALFIVLLETLDAQRVAA